MNIVYFNLSAHSSVTLWTTSSSWSYLDDITTIVLEVNKGIKLSSTKTCLYSFYLIQVTKKSIINDIVPTTLYK